MLLSSVTRLGERIRVGLGGGDTPSPHCGVMRFRTVYSSDPPSGPIGARCPPRRSSSARGPQTAATPTLTWTSSWPASSILGSTSFGEGEQGPGGTMGSLSSATISLRVFGGRRSKRRSPHPG